MQNHYKVITELDTRKLPMLFASLIIGIATGLLVVGYRLVLQYAEHFSIHIYEIVRGNLGYTAIWFGVLLINALFVHWLCKRFKQIGGSGIPQIKGNLMGYLRLHWFKTMLWKFIGSTLAIGSGLSLGREGPSIQLGGCMAAGLAKRLTKARIEMKILTASGASAGLAAAFNAPFAGVMFVLEELFRYFTPTLLLTAMTASISADVVSKKVFGLEPVFHFEITNPISLNNYWILICLGILMALAGTIYNHTLMRSKQFYDQISPKVANLKMILPFFTAGVIGLYLPELLGGGHHLVEDFSTETAFGWLALLLVGKFAFSMISFGSGAPGGIFFPLLIMGGLMGTLFGKFSIDHLGTFTEDQINSFIVLAMAGFFTAIVRAPVTGIILIIEMTGSFNHFLPLALVCLTAFVAADLMRSKPVYDSLLDHMLAVSGTQARPEEHNKKIMMDAIVQHGASIAGHCVKDIQWPERCLLLAIKRGEREMIPKGHTEILEGDYLVAMTDLNNEAFARDALTRMTTAE